MQLYSLIKSSGNLYTLCTVFHVQYCAVQMMIQCVVCMYITVKLWWTMMMLMKYKSKWQLEFRRRTGSCSFGYATSCGTFHASFAFLPTASTRAFWGARLQTTVPVKSYSIIGEHLYSCSIPQSVHTCISTCCAAKFLAPGRSSF